MQLNFTNSLKSRHLRKQTNGLSFTFFISHYYKTLVLLSCFFSAEALLAQIDPKEADRVALESRVREALKENGETIRFVENKGQLNNKDVLYYYEDGKHGVYIEHDRIRFVVVKDSLVHYEGQEEGFEDHEEGGTRTIVASHTFSLRLPGRNVNARLRTGDHFSTKYNYFFGENHTGTGARAAKELTLEEIYPGIDLRMYSTSEGEMEFDWVMDAGADYKKLQMLFTGQDDLKIDDKGNLVVGLRFTEVKFNVPVSYQVTTSGTIPVEFKYQQSSPGVVTFNTTSRIDPQYPLIIDPTLTWGTYLDGDNNTFDAYLFAIQVDPNDGMVYCAGGTNRPIPTGSAPYDADGYLNSVSGLTGAPPNPLPMCAVVYRINATGTDLVDLTMYGPSSLASSDKIVAYALSLSDNNVFVGGVTNRALPLTANAFDNSLGSGDGFVAVFPRNLGSLTYATYLGSNSSESLGVNAIRALNDNSFVVGMTVNAALPAGYVSGSAADNSFGGSTDMYIARFSNFNTVTWGTYVGGTGTDALNDIEVFGDGRVAFAGNGTGTITQVNGAAGQSGGSDTDGILGVLSSNGDSFLYLDEIGNSGSDRINDVEIVGNTLYWTGSAGSNFPVTAGLYDTSYNGGTDAVIGKVSAVGGSGTYAATYYGTSSSDLGNGIRLVSQTDCAGDETVFLLVFGTVGGSGLPTVNINGESFYKSTFTSGGTSNVDMFFAGFTDDLNALLYGTYMGGSQDDYLGETGSPRGSNHLWVNNANVYLGTTTHSTSHGPTLVAGGFDTSKSNGTNDSHLILTIDFNSLAESDFGDAPASYGSPSHILNCQELRIGALLDSENAAQPSAQANGDDNNNLDDEDGVTTFPVISNGTGQTFSVTVNNVINNTGGPATLYGWVDINSNGQFSSNEIATATVPNGNTGSIVLTWSGVTVSGSATGHFLRIRLTTNTLNDNSGTAAVDERSTVSASDGEVEDYLLIGLTCPPDQNEASCQTQAAINTKFNTWLASASAGGGCGGTLTNNNTGAPSRCGGSTTVTFTYTSPCPPTTSTCTATFTVAQDLPPSIATCAVTRNIQGCSTSAITGPAFSATGATSTEAVFENATNQGSVSDVCGITSVTYIDVAAGTCPITVSRTWTFTDGCGNTASCVQTILVNDNTSPIINCAPNVTVSCSASTVPPATGTSTATDNCGGTPVVTYSDQITPGARCEEEYVITRTWTATDACGNTATCNQIITVQDTQGPTVTCPPDVTINCVGSTLPPNTGSPTASDNCSDTFQYSYSDVTVSGPGEGYTIIRTWTATDGCGNPGTCEQEITVIDDNPPVITSHPEGFEECVGGIMTLSVSFINGNGTLSYQWQASPNGTSGWTNATGPGANTDTYTPPSTTPGTTYYRVVITSSLQGCSGVISNNAVVLITPDLSVNSHPSNVMECVGGTDVMQVVVSGGSGSYQYQWQQSPDGVTGWTNIAGATSSTYQPPSTTPGTTFFRVIINSN